MSIQNEELLKFYMMGFNDELKGNHNMWNADPLLLRAYNLGKKDAKIGDDLRSSDYQSNEEILKKIHQSNS